ncbi:TPA: hypothetical protein ACVU43_004077 [Vibrio parahaemolyticus]|nr:hypothetical protein [Vibrio parahaemolyticus]
MVNFEQRIAYLSEIAELPRQSVCFQFLMLLHLSHQGLTEGVIEHTHYEGVCFYESVSLREGMANAKSVSNAHKGIHALYDAGFIERLVLDKNAQPVVGEKFSRNSVKIYWRLTAKGYSLFK